MICLEEEFEDTKGG